VKIIVTTIPVDIPSREKTGVYNTPEGWSWRCSCGVAAEKPVVERIAARDAYKVHRAAHAATPAKPAGTPDPVAPPEHEKDPVPVTTDKKPVSAPAKKAGGRKKSTTSKATKKKATKKKAAGRTRKAAGSGKGTWYFAKITIKKGEKGEKRTLYPRLSASGMLDSTAAERLGVKPQQKEWWAVQAASQKDASASVKKGGGTRMTPSSAK
jgi:hypothetical protein